MTYQKLFISKKPPQWSFNYTNEVLYMQQIFFKGLVVPCEIEYCCPWHHGGSGSILCRGSMFYNVQGNLHFALMVNFPVWGKCNNYSNGILKLGDLGSKC